MLETWGLTTIDQAAYELWLRHPTWTVADVAGELSETEADVAACREALIGEGLLVADRRRPGQLASVGPDVVVDRWLADIEAAAASQRAQAMQARVHLSALAAAELSTDHSGWTGQRVRGRLRQARLDDLVSGARREIVALQPQGPAVGGLTGASADLDRRALRRGVTIRVLFPHDRLVHGDDLAYVRRLTCDGAQVCSTVRVPAAAMVVDRITVVLQVDRDGDPELVVLTDPAVAGTLADLCESCWERGQRCGTGHQRNPPAGGSADGLSGIDRTLLQLLALGGTDEAVARSMGVSVRTVRRHVSLLLDKLEATSRFQAGVQAARRGWL